MPTYLDAYLDSFAACLCAGVCWGGAAVVAWRVAARLLADAPLHIRVCGAATVATAIIVAVMLGLGVAGQMGRWQAAAVMAALVLGTRYWRARGGEVVQIRTWARERRGEGFAVAGCSALFLVMLTIIWGMRTPPLAWDSLTYRAFFPARWVQIGGFEPFVAPGGMDGYRAFPFYGELLTAFVALPFRSDALMNLVNLPVWLWAAVACYALGRQLGARPATGVVGACLFCSAPRVWGLATTQYVEILLAATLVTGLVFVLRHGWSGRQEELLIGGLSLGLAVGTRYSAISGIVLIAGCAGVLGLRRMVRRARGPVAARTSTTTVVGSVFAQAGTGATALRAPGCGTILRAVIAAGGFAGVVAMAGGFQYVKNAVAFGNPIYPFGLSILGHSLWQASEEMTAILARSPAGTRWDDLRQWAGLFAAAPDHWGPGLAVIVIGAFVAVAGARRRTWAVWVAALVCAGLIAELYLPGSGPAAHIRRGWPEVSQRFLIVPMAIAAPLAAAGLSRWRRIRKASPWIALAVIGVNAWVVRGATSLGWKDVICAIGVTALAVALGRRAWRTASLRDARKARTDADPAMNGWAILKPSLRDGSASEFGPAIRNASCIAVSLAAGALLTFHLTEWRNRARYSHYSGERALSSVARLQAKAWRSCDEPGTPHVVALAGRRRAAPEDVWSHAALNWFFYPLLGSKWQNTVVYAAPETGSGRGEDMELWVSRLCELGVDRLVILEGAEPEDAWAAANPGAFALLETAAKTLVYGVRREALAALAARENGRLRNGVTSETRRTVKTAGHIAMDESEWKDASDSCGSMDPANGKTHRN